VWDAGCGVTAPLRRRRGEIDSVEPLRLVSYGMAKAIFYNVVSANRLLTAVAGEIRLRKFLL